MGTHTMYNSPQRQNTRCNMKIFYHTLPHLSSEQSISHKLSGVSLETISFTVELVDDMSFRCTHNCASIVFSAIPHWGRIYFMGSHLIFHPNDVIVKIFKWGFSYMFSYSGVPNKPSIQMYVKSSIFTQNIYVRL